MSSFKIGKKGAQNSYSKSFLFQNGMFDNARVTVISWFVNMRGVCASTSLISLYLTLCSVFPLALVSCKRNLTNHFFYNLLYIVTYGIVLTTLFFLRCFTYRLHHPISYLEVWVISLHSDVSFLTPRFAPKVLQEPEVFATVSIPTIAHHRHPMIQWLFWITFTNKVLEVEVLDDSGVIIFYCGTLHRKAKR